MLVPDPAPTAVPATGSLGWSAPTLVVIEAEEAAASLDVDSDGVVLPELAS